MGLRFGKASNAQMQKSHTEGPKDGKKRSRSDAEDAQRTPRKQPRLEKGQSTLQFGYNSIPRATDPPNRTLLPVDESAKSPANMDGLKKILKRIHSHPSLTPYRKRLYSTLLSVPRGRYTTYAAMSDFLNSSARAVGNGMRNNPFAPDVPCHRVLAANRTVGGFKGDWGKDGKFAKEKIELLRGEGVGFDGSGKVIGEPFRKFHTFQAFE